MPNGHQERPDQKEHTVGPKEKITIDTTNCPVTVSFANHTISITRDEENLLCTNELGQIFTILPIHSLQTSRGSDGWFLEDGRRDYPRIDNKLAGEQIVIENFSNELTYTVTENAALPAQPQPEQLKRPSMPQAMDVVEGEDVRRTETFTDFERIRVEIGGISDATGQPVRTLMFNKYKKSDEIDIIVQDVNKRVTLKPGESMDIGRDQEQQLHWFRGDECGSISRNHLTVRNDNGTLTIKVHNEFPKSTIIEKVL